MTSGGDALELAQRSIQRSQERFTMMALDPQPEPKCGADVALDMAREAMTSRQVDPYRVPPPKRSVWGNRVGLFGALFVAALLALSWPLWALWLALGSLAVFWLNRAAYRAWDRWRLAYDADRQHAAILAGDDAYGIHGRFPCDKLYVPSQPPSPLDEALAELAEVLTTMDRQDPERDARVQELQARIMELEQ